MVFCGLLILNFVTYLPLKVIFMCSGCFLPKYEKTLYLLYVGRNLATSLPQVGAIVLTENMETLTANGGWLMAAA